MGDVQKVFKSIFLILLGGCLFCCAGSQPEEADVPGSTVRKPAIQKPVDMGPKPDNYEETSRKYLESIMFDPTSLKDFGTQPPVKASCAVSHDMMFWGWRVPVTYNVKDRNGEYVGRMTEYFWFHGETLQAVTSEPSSCPANTREYWLGFNGGP